MHMTMKDSLNHLFRERFQGHEAQVDPATWQVIEARLLTSAPPTDPVNELFQERFKEHHVDVDPSVWQGISAQLGHGAAAGGSLLGGFGWVAAGIAGALVAGALIWSLQEPAPQHAVPVLAETEQSVTAPVLPTLAPETAGTPEVVVSARHELGTSAVSPDRVSHSATDTPSSAPASSMPSSQAADPEAAPRDSNPELVEGIISDLAEQVRREVRETRRNDMPRDAGTTVAGESNMPPADVAQAKPEPAPVEEIKLFLPNVFTPNGDVQNETYRIEPKTGWLRTLVRVYSMKTNQLVFSTNNLADEWTGANCEDGYYLVAVELTTMDERVVSKGQVVWLNRSIMN